MCKKHVWTVELFEKIMLLVKYDISRYLYDYKRGICYARCDIDIVYVNSLPVFNILLN